MPRTAVLNLTLGVREGIIKHSRDYNVATHPELADYFLHRSPPLEAQIIDLADEIAYLTADLDDGVESGLLEIGQITKHVQILSRCFRQVATFGTWLDFPDIEEKYLFNESLQQMQNVLVDDLIGNTRHNLALHGLDDAGSCT